MILRAAAFASLVAVLLFPVRSAGAAPARADVSFDQIDQTVVNASTTLSGDFAKDATALSAKLTAGDRFPAPATNPAAGTHDDPLGTFRALQVGLLRRFSFLGTMSRVDDPISQKATIARPDVPEVIYLDLVRKTYRTVEGDAAEQLLTPADPSVLLHSLQNALPSGPGTATIDIQTTTNAIAARDIDGVAATGFSTETTIAARNVTGTCFPISMTIHGTTYTDQSRGEPIAHAFEATDPSVIAKGLALGGCTVTFGSSAAKRSSPPGFILYRLTQGDATLPVLNVPMKTASLIERGNIKALTPADAPMFAVPTGFTAAPPPSSAPVPSATSSGAP
jgi:hypothetical protein